MSMKKTLSMLVAAVLLVGATAACGGGSTASQPAAETPAAQEGDAPAQESPADQGAAAPSGDGIVLETWNGFTGSDGVVLTDLVNRYNVTNEDGIFVNMDIIPWDNFYQKLPQSIATGTAPDYVLLGYDQLGMFKEEGTLQPMDDYFEHGSVSKDNFNEAALDLFHLDGQQWQLPITTYGRAYYFWNKDLFEEAGLDPEKPGETWDEVLEIAAQIADPNRNVYGLSIPIRDNTLVHHMMMAEGYTWYDETARTSNMSQPAVQNVLTKLQTMIAEYQISPPSVTGPEMDNILFAGQLGQMFNGPWMIPGLRENEINFGVTVVPSGSKGQAGNFEGTGFAIINSTSEEHKLAVYKHMDYWYSDDVSVEWSVETGFPPFLNSVAADSRIQNDPVVSELSKSLDYVTAHYVGSKVMPTINEDVLNPLLENVLYGGADVAEATATADEAMNALLAGE